MGGALGHLWAAAGYDVVFSAAPSGRLFRLARAAGKLASVGSPREAAQADVVLLAVGWDRVNEVLQQAAAFTGALAGRTVIDCTLPACSADDHVRDDVRSSGCELIATMIPGANVVKAFATIRSETLMSVATTLAFESRRELAVLPICGDDAAAKHTVEQLVRALGFRAVDVGGLERGRELESFGLVQRALANETGPQLDAAIRYLPFSVPLGHILFSRNPVITIGDSERCATLALRVVNAGASDIVNVRARMILRRTRVAQPSEDDAHGCDDLELVLRPASLLGRKWVVRHAVDEHSPIRAALTVDGVTERFDCSLCVSVTADDRRTGRVLYAAHAYPWDHVRSVSRAEAERELRRGTLVPGRTLGP
jgi:predicted dinucleotide-binding enzyme